MPDPTKPRPDLHRVGSLTVPLELLSELLGLPPGHEVVGILREDAWTRSVALAVAGPDMPPVQFGQTKPDRVVLQFSVSENGGACPSRTTSSRWEHAPSDAPWHPVRTCLKA